MAAYTSALIGAPTTGFWNKGDTYTDANGTVFTCIATGYSGPVGIVGSTLAQWSPNPGGLGDLMGAPILHTAVNGQVAFAGGGQAGAIAGAASQIVQDITRFVTVVTIGDSGALPAAVKGKRLTVNNTAANSMNVFPQVGEAINALAVNVAYALAGGKTAQFTCAVNGTWDVLLSA
jgi:hypothetical protein